MPVLLLGLLMAFLLPLILYKPRPKSLREVSNKNMAERALEVKGSLILGVLLIIIFVLSLDMETLFIKDGWLYYLGLHRYGLDDGLFYQVVTNNFIHYNLLHIGSNLIILMLLSAYERRVGTLRYLLIFLLAGVVSSVIQAVFIPYEIVTIGSSAGIAGLVAGHFLDLPRVGIKQWLIGLIFVSILVFAASFTRDGEYMEVVDWAAHMLGAFSAAVFVKLRPIET